VVGEGLVESGAVSVFDLAFGCRMTYSANATLVVKAAFSPM
jgi:hypothetical protein